MSLDSLIDDLRAFPGIRRKGNIGRVLDHLDGAWQFGWTHVGPGDDAAVLERDGRYLLLAADGILPLLVERDPYRAGRALVLVNANDVYAMGGRPLAMVNVLAGVTEAAQGELLRGVRDECRRLRVPMVGGHVSPGGGPPFVAGGILGEAANLLCDRAARAGQALLLAVDRRGERWGDYLLNWDSHVFKTSEELLEDLAVLCRLAEDGLCVSAKDVSNAGILGTLGMLLEGAGLGARVDLDRIEAPEAFSLADWLKVYPSYGFLLACEKPARGEALARFRERGIWAEEIGETDPTRRLRVCRAGEEATLFDLRREGVMNLSKRGEGP